MTLSEKYADVLLDGGLCALSAPGVVYRRSAICSGIGPLGDRCFEEKSPIRVWDRPPCSDPTGGCIGTLGTWPALFLTSGPPPCNAEIGGGIILFGAVLCIVYDVVDSRLGDPALIDNMS